MQDIGEGKLKPNLKDEISTKKLGNKLDIDADGNLRIKRSLFLLIFNPEHLGGKRCVP